MPTQYITTNVRLPKSLHKALKRRAVEEEVSFAELIREALLALDIVGDGHYSVIVRDGKADGNNKSVDHLHFHVVPEVRLGDLDHQGNEREILNDEGVRRVMNRFSKVFKK